jgi:uncharacterized protein YheU (UPF0270 family)
LSKSVEVVPEPLDDCPQGGCPDCREEGVEVPLERISPETLRSMVAEFVTREWEEVGDAHHTLDDKVDQVLRQLKERKAKVVFDLTSNSCNIVPCR